MASDNKYDRQLRLWGANGQKALMESSVALLNANSLGSEILKNLVLPGVSEFTIIDGKNITKNDLGMNFFVWDEYILNISMDNIIGMPRAKCVCELLNEMNSDVKGSWRAESPHAVISADINYFLQFHLIIAVNVSLNDMSLLSQLCWDHNIPLIYLNTNGFIGLCRLQLSNHCIIESKPSHEQYDLRLANPWNELKDFFDSFDLDQQDNMEHAQTPYFVILYKALNIWKEQNNNNIPSNYEEKELFKNLIKNLSRNFGNEINYEEAIKQYYQAYQDLELPYEVTSLFNDEEVLNLSSTSDKFFILIKALKEFIDHDENNLPPLSGKIPDMTSATEPYVNLQEIYLNKANNDLSLMKEYCINILTSLNRSVDEINDNDITIFCKNIFNLQKIKTRTINEEFSSIGDDIKRETTMCIDFWDDPEQTPFLFYIALYAVLKYEEKYNTLPGDFDDNENDSKLRFEHEVDEVWKIMQEYMTEINFNCEHIKRKHAYEMVRYGGAELHNISAILGGIASQEAVKILTKQYIPIQGTFLYNGIACVGEAYTM